MAALILPQSASLVYARVLLRLGELVEPYIAAESLVLVPRYTAVPRGPGRGRARRGVGGRPPSSVFRG
eukprot:7073342-Prymnesium_polylepis.1